MIRTTFDKIKLSKTTKFIVDNRGKTAPTEETGIALIATNCISNSKLYPSYDNIRYVSQETYDTWFRAHPVPGDIIVTNKGSQNGAICLVPDPVDFVIAQDMMALRTNEKVIDPLFLFAALRSPMAQWQIKSLDVSGVIPHFKKSDFDKLFLPYPDMPTQKAIGKIYFDFCAKIESNRRMNTTLESMARAIFKSWFVDFDPVKINAGQMTAGSHGTEVLKLFPSAFQDSELGRIPAGWEVGKFSQNIDILSGGTPKTKVDEYWNGDIPWYTVKDAPEVGNVWGIDTERKVTQLGIDNSAAEIFEIGTSIISARGTVGKIALIGVPMSMNQSCYGIKGVNGFGDLFTYFQLNILIENLQQNTHGTVFDTITRATFDTVTCVHPSVKVAEKYDETITALLSEIRQNLIESASLAEIRDALLPKLLSGELSVPEALTATEEVLVNG